MPADLAYGSLLKAVGHDVEAIAKDLEVYARPEPRPVNAVHEPPTCTRFN
jgi:hypothetical protein